MRRLEDTPLDPEIEATLDAIDATLAGDPVDPRFAEIAELALLLADERPTPSDKFARELDAKVGWRFAQAPAREGMARAPRRRGWDWTAVGGAMAAAVMLVAIVLVIGNAGGGGSASSSNTYASSTSAGAPQTLTSPASSSSAASTSSSSSSASGALGLPSQADSNQSAKSASAGSVAHTATPAMRSYSPQESPTPATNGRVIVQSAELDLAAAPSKIDTVAQEVFNVVGQAGGIVDHSSVTQTGGTDGYASFQLRIPSSALASTLNRLSALSGATVVSRTDNSQDVNSQWVSAHRQLADDRALRAALLKQLAAATTTGQIDSLNTRIHDAEQAIAADEANINALSSQIDYSKVVLNINARPMPPAPVKHHSGGGFLGRSAHIAGRVLVVAAGVALIALAALVPVGLLAALIAWVTYTLRRRRREQALDMA